VSEPDLDQLAEAARNRGLKLVRSRVRTPGKRRFGKVGLADMAAKPVFGMDAKGPTAKPEEVQAYLRKLGVKDWGASLDVAAPQRKRTGKRPPEPHQAANDEPPRLKSRPKPAPTPKVRDAKPADAKAVADLIAVLDHDIDEKAVRKNLTALAKAGEPPLVATLDKQVVGLCGVHRMVVPHRPAPVGRITILVVAEEFRGKEIGRTLVDAAEAWMRKAGCRLAEVTSNDRLTAAHAFYRHMGYERTSIRFKKDL
jgi:GNAT superfamily N-acetyltransferase